MVLLLMVAAVFFAKKQVLPSGVKVIPNSSSGVEMIPAPKSVTAGFGTGPLNKIPSGCPGKMKAENPVKIATIRYCIQPRLKSRKDDPANYYYMQSLRLAFILVEKTGG